MLPTLTPPLSPILAYFYLQVGHDLASKVMELETYRDILCRQVDLLQAYFDSLSEGMCSVASL